LKASRLDLATDLVSERGRIVIAGYHQDGLRQINMQKWNWKGIDVINAHERDPHVYMQGIRRAIQAVAQGQLDPLPLFTHTYPMHKAAMAFRDLHEKPQSYFKGLLLT
jgi:threonine dehydrogenase-like Zn-dependent dehydrogenase